MTVNEIKSYLSSLNKSVDQYNNTCHRSINKTPINDDYSALTEEIELRYRTPKFKIGNVARITKCKKVTLVKIGQKKYSLSILC